MINELKRMVDVVEKFNKSLSIDLVNQKELTQAKKNIANFELDLSSLKEVLDMAQSTQKINSEVVTEVIARLNIDFLSVLNDMENLHEVIVLAARRHAAYLDSHN